MDSGAFFSGGQKGVGVGCAFSPFAPPSYATDITQGLGILVPLKEIKPT